MRTRVAVYFDRDQDDEDNDAFFMNLDTLLLQHGGYDMEYESVPDEVSEYKSGGPKRAKKKK